MLSYQHSYHAGNLADVHKHAALSWVLDYLTQKDKPISYIETHAGRALYDLSGSDAKKTGEAQKGIKQTIDWFSIETPYRKAIDKIKDRYGKQFYPGSPLIAKMLLRPNDCIHLAELHPQEATALKSTINGAHIVHQDGYQMAQSLCPPTPRRGLMLIDPSYEISSEYETMGGFVSKINRKWNVGIIMLWYPILKSGDHLKMINLLKQKFPTALNHSVDFAPAKKGHGMIGSGLFFINQPFSLDEYLKSLKSRFDSL